MEVPRNDIANADVELFLQNGLFDFMTSHEGLLTGPERFRAAYNYAWKIVRELLLGKITQTAPPREQLEEIFSRIYNVRGTDQEKYLTFALIIRLKHSENPMIHRMLYDGFDEEPYEDEATIKEIEEICWTAEFSEQPRYVAEFIMSYIETVHLTYVTMPAKDPKDNLALEDSLIGLRQIFEKVS